jgi:hypothetical protein
MSPQAPDPRSKETAQRVLQFDFTRDLFERNYRELRVYVTHLQDPRIALDISGEDSRWLRHEAMQEVGFLLHNFVAAAQSLVDHARVVYRQLYEPGGLVPEYQAEVEARFITDPLSQFVIGLRQMAQHYRLPNIGLTQSFTMIPGGGGRATVTVRVLLRVDDLQSFGSWNASAKKYMAAAGTEISISDLCESYYNHIIAFYDWFDACRTTVHGAAPAIYSRLTKHGIRSPEAEIVAAITANVDALSKVPRGEITYEKLFGALAPALTLMDQRALMLCQHDATCWIEEAVRALLDRFPTAASLKAKLVALVSQDPPAA